MRKHIYTGAMGSTYFALVSGIFFVYYGTRIGITRFQWGLMGGISSFALAAQLASALVTQRLGRRKLLWLVSAMLGRAVRLMGILGSLWLWHEGSRWAAVALIGGICTANFFSAVATPPWMSWLADLIPEREHGGFWGRRAAWIALSVVCATVPASLLMDRVPEVWKLHTAVAIFVGATVLGLIDLIIHGTLPEPAMELPERNHVVEQLLAPVRDRGFRPWLVFNLCWTFSMTLGGSLATIYFVEELGIRKNFLGGTIVLTVVSLLGGILTAPGTGRLVDRAGPKRVLTYGHLFWALLPGFWLMASPRTALVWLGLASLTSGIASSAAVTAANKLITRFPPAQDRAMYVAVSSCLGSLAGGIGAIAAGTLLRALEGWSFTVWSSSFGAFHVLFVASLALRMASAVLLIPALRDPARRKPDGC
jgi:MFS family permease